jgi:hypothetical protein
MKTTTTILILLMLAACTGQAQDRKAQEMRLRHAALLKPEGLPDRAGGTHDKSNIGLFFENRGKLYPHQAIQGPSGRFPVTSDPVHEYIYRINPMIGVPGNIVQGRYTTDEEWEAVGGFNNTTSAKVAFSDDPTSWPSTGWPVKDAEGHNLFISDQDSYCVYSDSNNGRAKLGLQVNQTGYAFNLKLIQDMIIYKFDIVNRSAESQDSLYFGLYIDLDIGEGGSGTEYQDDRLEIDRARNLMYFFDADGFSADWGGAPGYFGMMMLSTPLINGVMGGMTDAHYNIYDNDYDIDSVQYGIYSSAPGLYASSAGPRYFHLGVNAPNLHFDDPATIPTTGLDLVGNIGSGPYTINPGDTLSFVTAIVAGNTRADILSAANQAIALVGRNYSRPLPPQPPPEVTVVPGDRRVTIRWDNRAESYIDPISNHRFEGYRIYKSIDLGQHWDQIDRNQQIPPTGADPVPLATFDRIDGVAPDNGLQYTYVDTTVVNGFEYWYSVTAYDKADSLVPSLENARGNNDNAPNLGVAIPRSEAGARTPVSATALQQIGTGVSNVVFSVQPTDVPEAGDRTYEIRFAPKPTTEAGNLQTSVTVTVDTVLAATANDYSIAFLSPNALRIRNLTQARIVRPSVVYHPDSAVVFSGLRVVMHENSDDPDLRPQAGDSIVIRMSVRVASGSADLLPLQQASAFTRYATSNGVIFSFGPVDPLPLIRQTSGAEEVSVGATVSDSTLIVDGLYRIRIDTVYVDSLTSGLKANISVLNTADSVVRRSNGLASGGSLTLTGVALTVTYNTIHAQGAIVEVQLVKPRPLTYRDAFGFSTIGARIDHAAIASALGRVKVVPNPYIVSSQFEREYGSLRREPIRQLKFINLPAQCTIQIFTVAGDIVQTLVHDAQDGTETWDLRGAGGRVIAPGVYLYRVVTADGERLNRFAVIK